MQSWKILFWGMAGEREVTINWNGGHVEGRQYHVHRVYSGQHTNATNFCLENVILLYWKNAL